MTQNEELLKVIDALIKDKTELLIGLNSMMSVALISRQEDLYQIGRKAMNNLTNPVLSPEIKDRANFNHRAEALKNRVNPTI